MPVIGAVLRLSEDARERDSALSALREHPNISLGDLQQNGGCPVAIEFDCKSEEKTIWEQIGSMKGVLFSTVVFADFSDLVLEESGV